MVLEKKFYFGSPIKLYAPADLSKKWFIYFYSPTGKRIRKYGDINTASTYESRLAIAISLAETFENSEVKLDSHSLLLEAEKATKGRSKSTRRVYRCACQKLVTYLAGRDMTHDLLSTFSDHLKDTVHPTTRNTYLRVIKLVLNRAGRGEVVPKGWEFQKSTKTPAKYFQRHQIKFLKEVILNKSPELWLMVELMYYCFIRPHEAVRLKVDDILFDDRKIFISKKIGKTNKDRYPVIPKPFLESLEKFKTYHPNEYLFPSKHYNRTHQTKNSLRKRHREILEEIGFDVSRYKLYSWRHTGAVQFIKAGGKPKHLQLQMGHATLEQTDQYLRQMGIQDLGELSEIFPEL